MSPNDIPLQFAGVITKVNGTVDGGGLGDAATLTYDCEAISTKSQFNITAKAPCNRHRGVTKVVAAKKGDAVIMFVCPAGETCNAVEYFFAPTEVLSFEGC